MMKPQAEMHGSDESGLCGATPKPLSEITELVRTRFPKYVSIPDSKFNIIKKDGALWKKQHYNEYCYIRFSNNSFEMTLFKCDWIPFEKIENAYMDDSTSFAIKNMDEVKVILNCLV